MSRFPVVRILAVLALIAAAGMLAARDAGRRRNKAALLEAISNRPSHKAASRDSEDGTAGKSIRPAKAESGFGTLRVTRWLSMKAPRILQAKDDEPNHLMLLGLDREAAQAVREELMRVQDELRAARGRLVKGEPEIDKPIEVPRVPPEDVRARVGRLAFPATVTPEQQQTVRQLAEIQFCRNYSQAVTVTPTPFKSTSTSMDMLAGPSVKFLVAVPDESGTVRPTVIEGDEDLSFLWTPALRAYAEELRKPFNARVAENKRREEESLREIREKQAAREAAGGP